MISISLVLVAKNIVLFKFSNELSFYTIIRILSFILNLYGIYILFSKKNNTSDIEFCYILWVIKYVIIL